jgi:hypothetical protein
VLRTVVATAIALVLASTIGIHSPDAATAAPATGIVAGIVTGSDGAPAVGIDVSLRYANGWSRDADTDASGAYRFDGVEPGRYTVSFSCWTSCVGNYHSEYWEDTRSFDDRTWFDLADGEHVHLQTELELAGEITGTVQGDDGKPLEDVNVYIESATAGIVPPRDRTHTDASGRYRLRNLPEGGYTLRFAPAATVHEEAYFGEHWKDAATADAAEVIHVAAGEVVSGIDAGLTPAAWISGRVVNEDGVPADWAADVGLTLYRVTDAGVSSFRTEGLPFYLGYGAFRFAGLPAGTYLLRTRALGWGVAEWWQDESDMAAADRIVVEAGDRFDTTIVLEGGPASILGPTVTGTARVGETLTASASSPTPGATLSYQWTAGGVPVEGATGTQFTPAADHVGQQVAVSVTATAPDRARMTHHSSPTQPVALGVLTAPTPSIVGDRMVGTTLTVRAGDWQHGTELAYRWYRSDTLVSTASQLTLTSEHVGGRIRVEVTGSKPGYTPAMASSASTLVVLHGEVELTQPTVSGIPQVGSPLTAVVSSATPGVALFYQWYADGDPILRAATPTLTLRDEHIGARIAVRVTGNAPLYAPTARNSVPTRAVVDPAWRNTPGLFGPDLFTRSVEISAPRFEPGVMTVYLANGSRFPDAAAALRLAGGEDPVLLTSATTVPAVVLGEIQRLKPRYIVILGGTDAVSSAIEPQLEGLSSHGIHRIVDWDGTTLGAGPQDASTALSAGTAAVEGGATDGSGSREDTPADLAPAKWTIITRVGALG